MAHSNVMSGRLKNAPCKPRAWQRVYNRSLTVPAKCISSCSSALTADCCEGVDLGWRTDLEHQYVRGKCVGSGSFGTVYKGVHLCSGQEVAIKIMPKERPKLTKEQTLEKLLREVDTMDTLQGCYGAVELLDCFEDYETVSLVTEFCSGGDLQKLSDANGLFSERCLALVALEVLKILKACHENGVLHGDVKPANFVMKHQRNPLTSRESKPGSSAWLRAIDFGCSQQLDGTRFTKRKGTPVYMAPEIFKRDYGQEADMWSMGVMLYQLYSRRFPFWSTATSCKSSKLEDIAVSVATAEITFDYGPWRVMSREGLEFLDGCLQRDFKNRLTISEALQHSWIRSVSSTLTKQTQVCSNIVPSPHVVRDAVQAGNSLVKNVLHL